MLPCASGPRVGGRAVGLSSDADAAVALLACSLPGTFFREAGSRIAGMSQPYAVVIGASAGGVSALIELAAALPANFPALVGMVLHVGSQRSILPELVSARGPLRAVHARDGDRLVPGKIYIAPPDHHMLFTLAGVRLHRGPRENHARPAIDPLFRSAAMHWRERAIGVVLTGDLGDGTAGLAAIKECGGSVIVQDPATASKPSMPASALANVAVDQCLQLHAIAPALRQRVGDAPVATASVPRRMLQEQAVGEGSRPLQNPRCDVRSLQEREVLLRRLAGVSRSTGDEPQAQAGLREADRLRQRIRTMIGRIEGDRASA